MNNQDIEDKIKEYVINGGRLFTIKLIDTIRDGGTKIITCTNGDTFYIDKNSTSFHRDYPLCNKNMITDLLLKTYLLERIETYVKRCEEDVERNKVLLSEIQNI